MQLWWNWTSLKLGLGQGLLCIVSGAKTELSLILIPDLSGISGSTSPMLWQYNPTPGSSVLKEAFLVAGAKSKFLFTSQLLDLMNPTHI